MLLIATRLESGGRHMSGADVFAASIGAAVTDPSVCKLH